jgi:hypothetical protein
MPDIRQWIDGCWDSSKKHEGQDEIFNIPKKTNKKGKKEKSEKLNLIICTQCLFSIMENQNQKKTTSNSSLSNHDFIFY